MNCCLQFVSSFQKSRKKVQSFSAVFTRISILQQLKYPFSNNFVNWQMTPWCGTTSTDSVAGTKPVKKLFGAWQAPARDLTKISHTWICTLILQFGKYYPYPCTCMYHFRKSFSYQCTWILHFVKSYPYQWKNIFAD